jgi:hypothetical protein
MKLIKSATAAAFAAIAAIGFSLNACGEKSKEPPKLIFGTPIDINNIPFGASMEKVKKTYGVELEDFTAIDGTQLFKATGTSENKFAFRFDDSKLSRVYILFNDKLEELVKKEVSELCDNRRISTSYEGGFAYSDWDYKGKLSVLYLYTEGPEAYASYVSIYQKEAESSTSDNMPKLGMSIEEVKKFFPDMEEDKEQPELLSVGVRKFSEGMYELMFYKGKLYAMYDDNGSKSDPDVEATIEEAKRAAEVAMAAAVADSAALAAGALAAEAAEYAAKATAAGSEALVGDWRGEGDLSFFPIQEKGWGYGIIVDENESFDYTIKGDIIILSAYGKYYKNNFKIKGDRLTITPTMEESIGPIVGKYKRHQRYKPPKPDSETEALTKSIAKTIEGKWIGSNDNGRDDKPTEFQACSYNEEEGICYGNYITNKGDYFYYAIRGNEITGHTEHSPSEDQFDPNGRPPPTKIVIINEDKWTWEGMTFERVKE